MVAVGGVVAIHFLFVSHRSAWLAAHMYSVGTELGIWMGGGPLEEQEWKGGEDCEQEKLHCIGGPFTGPAMSPYVWAH